MSEEKRKTGVFRKTFSLWFSAPIAAANQIRESGKRFRDLAAEVGEEVGKRNPNAEPETFADAMSHRPADASDLETIRQAFVRYKNIATFFLIVSVTACLGNIAAGVLAGGFMAAALAFLAYAFSFRFTLRIWEIDARTLVSVADYKKHNPRWLIDTLSFAQQEGEAGKE